MTGLVVGLAALTILTAYLTDVGGWLVDPGVIGIVLLVQIGVAFIWCARRVRLEADLWDWLGWFVVVGGLFGYLMWMAAPSGLPISQSGDLVHHVSLIDFIVHRRHLPHDPTLERYLGEFASYTPGSHLLAALVAGWLRLPGLRVLHPLLALLVAIKAGLVYHLSLRLMPKAQRDPAIAVAGAALLLLPWGYFLLSFIGQFYYAQVVAETFAIAMLWALVVWDEQPSKSLAGFAALCGVAVWLTWPVWLLIPVAAWLGLLLIRRDLALGARAATAACLVGPIALVAGLYTVGRVGQTAILGAPGVVVEPAMSVYGRPFLALVALGAIVSLRQHRALPLVLFAGATIAQIAILWWLAGKGLASQYFVYKMFHVLLYPMALFAALALVTITVLLRRWWSAIGGGRWRLLVLLYPLVIVALALRRDLPSRPYSAVSEPVYEVGQWTKRHIPPGCVDYLVDHWATAYWLHIHILGNPRATSRSEAIVHDFVTRRTTPARWGNPDHVPFAIVDNLETVPPDVRQEFTILYQANQAAVVQRGSMSRCENSDPPLDSVVVAPREHTLASLFKIGMGLP